MFLPVPSVMESHSYPLRLQRAADVYLSNQNSDYNFHKTSLVTCHMTMISYSKFFYIIKFITYGILAVQKSFLFSFAMMSFFFEMLLRNLLTALASFS